MHSQGTWCPSLTLPARRASRSMEIVEQFLHFAGGVGVAGLHRDRDAFLEQVLRLANPTEPLERSTQHVVCRSMRGGVGDQVLEDADGARIVAEADVLHGKHVA